MPNIRVEFEFPVPDEWGSDTFTQGKTDRDFYEGPEYLTFEVDNDPSSEDYGKETGWCLFEPEELERPVPENVTRITVDCKREPFLCEIANDCGHPEDDARRFNRDYNVLWGTPEGYTDVEQPGEFLARDIYDEWNITYNFDTDEFNVPVRTWEMQGVDKSLTWEHVRLVRNDQLAGTDAKMTPDMPANLRTKYETFRRLLRELPQTLQQAGYEPWQAMMMFPPHPDTDTAPLPSLMGGQDT